jgi:hypothetical protein
MLRDPHLRPRLQVEDLLSVFFRHAIADADGQLTERGGRVVR